MAIDDDIVESDEVSILVIETTNNNDMVDNNVTFTISDNDGERNVQFSLNLCSM